jgi:hypothetical protein
MAKGRNEEVSELLKKELTQKAERLIWKMFKPGLPAQAEAARKYGFNYISDVYTVWRGRSFYFCARYCNPRDDVKEKQFEVRTTRMAHECGRQFNLSYMRHTGNWCEVFQGLSLEECLETIEKNELYWPVH